MYKGPMREGPALSAPPAVPVAAEPAVLLPAALTAATASATANAVSVYVDDTPKARNEAWARLHGDPMLMVRICTLCALPFVHMCLPVECTALTRAHLHRPPVLPARRSSSRSRRP